MIIKNILKGQQGIALLMIMTAITILTALLTDFVYENNVIQFKVYNTQDRAQAKLNAEAGLNLAIARLRLYQEAFNLYEKNKEKVGKTIKRDILNAIWNIPFMYPIPTNPKMNITQRDAVEDFAENSLIEGSLSVEIQNISNRMNINLLRVVPKSEDDQNNSTETESDVENEFGIEQQLVKMLRRKFLQKEEAEDEEFLEKYEGVEPERLVAALKHYVSEPESFDGQFNAEFNSNYDRRGFRAKHAPISDLSEILMIDGWDQTLLDMIINSITCHGVVMIDLNKINKDGLQMLFPNIEEEQIKEFFTYKNDPEDPKFFNTIDDFKAYIVTQAGIVTEDTFNKTIAGFSKKGVQFGTAGSLFKVISAGKYQRSTYNLIAYVAIPSKPKPKFIKKLDKNGKETNQQGQDGENGKGEDEENDGQNQRENTRNNNNQNKKKKPEPLSLMTPRVVEIDVN